MCPVHSRKTAPTWTMESAGAMSVVMPRDAGNKAENGEHKNERRRWHEEHEEYGGNDGDDGSQCLVAMKNPAQPLNWWTRVEYIEYIGCATRTY